MMLRQFSSQRAILGESPIWDPAGNCLWWVDIVGSKIFRRGMEDGSEQVWERQKRPTALGIDSRGGLVVAFDDGIHRWNPEKDQTEFFTALDGEPEGNRCNDGKCDPYGRFWVGTMDDAETAVRGALYCVEPSGKTHQLLNGIGISNTLAWDTKRSVFYFADSMAQLIWAFDFDPEKPALKNRRIHVDLRGTDIYPDGSCIDAEGGLWNAQWDGWRVVRYLPDGTEDRIITLPVQKATSCAMGGPKGKTLFITTAAKGLSEAGLAEQPQAGATFCVEVDVPGLRMGAFGTDISGEDRVLG